ncbi:dienelactone hydrolase [Rhodovulum sulfidophilum]|uniref:alpha/beta hydrolase family protein n=1 Tax=Rhodovulum sulfidophilum TaxID=35806 RepID=UPI00191346C9|nr:alpha/beta fold hydrolase [Rhodovulum sulfidophilum]MBK5925460.1 dienelactone hydrolase [Rhodovulum sulfidophilum]
MFRALRLAAFAMLAIIGPWGPALAAPYHAGVARSAFTTASGQANAVIWYPTDLPEISWQAGPFEIDATREAPVAEGRFPVVLLSHGHNGGPLSHRELAAQLARAGFIVIAPAHMGDTAGQPPRTSQDRILKNRPAQAIAALDAALRNERLAPHADPARIGMIGYSAGGYTGLILAGAKPDFDHAAAYCAKEGHDDTGSCGEARFIGISEKLATWSAPSEARLKALVLLDPLAVMFDATGLADVGIPVLLFRPQEDIYMRSAANAVALARDLPRAPQEIVLPGTHFTFVDPCPKDIAGKAAMVCNDPPGIDRPAIHRSLEDDVIAFLNETL